MPRFSANISTLFQEVPLLERIGLAAEHGFDGIEIQFPYCEEPAALRAELDKWQLPLVLMNFPVGDLMEGGEGLAAVPGLEVSFDNALSEAREYAEILRPGMMNLLAGRPDASHDPSRCQSVFQRSLRKACAVTREYGIHLVTEPVNTVSMPGFFLSGSQQAIDLIDAMPEIELRIQYDLYHMQIMERDVLTRLPAILDRVGHIQFSDLPDRTEPRGGIDFDRVFQLLDALDYPGFVGAEYFPTTDTTATLEWMAPYKAD